MKTAEEFKAFYTQELSSTLQELEFERKKGTRLVTFLLLTILAGGFGIALPFILILPSSIAIVSGVALVLGIVYWSIKIYRVSSALKVNLRAVKSSFRALNATRGMIWSVERLVKRTFVFVN